MVDVMVGEIKWSFVLTPDKRLTITRTDKVIGWVNREIPSTKKLLDIAFEGIGDDIRAAIRREAKAEHERI